MSAYIVSPEQIQTIVTWANRNHALPCRATPEETARVLAEANIASVEYRYPDLIGCSVKAFLSLSSNEEYIEACQEEFQGPLPTATGVIKLINSLDYQSCEREDWEESLAYQYLNRMRTRATYSLPGYSDQPWSI